MPSPAPLTQQAGPIPPAVKRPVGSRWGYAFLIDIAVFIAVFGVVVGMYSIGRSWLGPVRVESEISQDPRSLWAYATYSLVRILVAYVSNYFVARLGQSSWRWMFGLGALPAFFLCLALLWIPERPRWLVQRGLVQRRLVQWWLVRRRADCMRGLVFSYAVAHTPASYGGPISAPIISHTQRSLRLLPLQ